MVYIYVLELQSNKYYVGKTTDPVIRIDRHFNSTGSAWTKKYKPLKVVEILPDCDDFDEDKYTKIYMGKFGIENVRGGSFCQITLDPATIEVLQRIICSATDKCYKCNQEGHFAAECQHEPVENVDICFRCGRKYHLATNCYAKNHIYGKTMHACYRCGREDHWKITCSAHTDIFGRKLKKSSCIIM